jgi:hypothetical protein
LQFEIGTTRSAYQNVTTAFDVTESGQRDCYGVRADGIDDGYATAGNVDFSGTDKVTVFAAIRNLQSSTAAALLELSSTTASGSGKFAMFAPLAANVYAFRSRGSTNSVDANSAASFAAPDTAILTGQASIAEPIVTLRRNGVQIASDATSQGTGNYIDDILYLFRRGGTTIPFNGNLYALIVAGGSYPLSTIQRVEKLLSRITPTVNL